MCAMPTSTEQGTSEACGETCPQLREGVGRRDPCLHRSVGRRELSPDHSACELRAHLRGLQVHLRPRTDGLAGDPGLQSCEAQWQQRCLSRGPAAELANVVQAFPRVIKDLREVQLPEEPWPENLCQVCADVVRSALDNGHQNRTCQYLHKLPEVDTIAGLSNILDKHLLEREGHRHTEEGADQGRTTDVGQLDPVCPDLGDHGVQCLVAHFFRRGRCGLLWRYGSQFLGNFVHVAQDALHVGDGRAVLVRSPVHVDGNAYVEHAELLQHNGSTEA
mmetsp:Transcript_125971/g.350958  ORF Transcript_125971/g.350958 Transcript_125971/m.350958 type:complete len:276 (-) Transcript_125971:520-1347(-)